MRINQSDLDNYGYIDRCPQCEHAKKYGKIRPGGNHSDPCSARIMECIRDTEAGRKRLNEQEFREAKSAVDRDDYLDKRRAQNERVEAVRAREPAADAALARDRRACRTPKLRFRARNFRRPRAQSLGRCTERA